MPLDKKYRRLNFSYIATREGGPLDILGGPRGVGVFSRDVGQIRGMWATNPGYKVLRKQWRFRFWWKSLENIIDGLENLSRRPSMVRRAIMLRGPTACPPPHIEVHCTVVYNDISFHFPSPPPPNKFSNFNANALKCHFRIFQG